MQIEYRVKPVTRYIVTRHFAPDHGAAETRQLGGEYASAELAYAVGYALARQEAENCGYATGDDRMQYPRRLDDFSTPQAAKPEFYKGYDELDVLAGATDAAQKR